MDKTMKHQLQDHMEQSQLLLAKTRREYSMDSGIYEKL